jgi:hypothetical protein
MADAHIATAGLTYSNCGRHASTETQRHCATAEPGQRPIDTQQDGAGLALNPQEESLKDQLRTAATDMIKQHGTISAAAKPMADKLAKDAELRLLAATEILRLVAPKSARKKLEPRSMRRTGPHRRPETGRKKLPTAQQKTGALQAERAYRDEIFDRKIRGGRKLGDLRVHELRAVAQASAETAASFLTRGYEDAVLTIACTMMAGHCVAADPHATVRDTIKATVATNIFERAQLRAAETIRDGSARLAHELLSVAAAQQITVQ